MHNRAPFFLSCLYWPCSWVTSGCPCEVYVSWHSQPDFVASAVRSIAQVALKISSVRPLPTFFACWLLCPPLWKKADQICLVGVNDSTVNGVIAMYVSYIWLTCAHMHVLYLLDSIDQYDMINVMWYDMRFYSFLFQAFFKRTIWKKRSRRTWRSLLPLAQFSGCLAVSAQWAGGRNCGCLVVDL